MISLQDILYGVALRRRIGPAEVRINALQFDSRKLQPADLFVAVRGWQTDGHQFIADAIAAGANAIVCEELPEQQPENVVFLVVENSARALGVLAANYYHNPSEEVQVVGVTGTNGKTTVTSLLYRVFTELGYPCGLLGTTGVRIEGKVVESTHTTPDALRIQELLAEMRDAGCAYCFMEVSSHAAHQQRIAGIRFAGAVFTNLTHDHLDYHGSFQNYLLAKKSFFDGLDKDAFALTNIDDRNGTVMLQNTRARKKSYSLETKADYRGRILEKSFEGFTIETDGQEVFYRLPGVFNAYNMLAVYGTALELEQNKEEVLVALSKQQSVPGRFELVQAPGAPTGIVDYAHTPDALQNVLETVQDIRRGAGAIYTVIGCGGDRDTAKRPQMARIAVLLSDWVYLTNDNPRTEDPEHILDEMETGVPVSGRKKVLRIANRREAIRAAVLNAQPEDIIVVAGKGHETYQEIQGKRLHFDDREELRNAIKERTA